MELGLTGKVAAITGGSAGIGRAAAFRLAEEGARVAICARRMAALQTTAAEIEAATGAEVLALRADLADPIACERFLQRVVARFGRLDILVNNAGRPAAMSFDRADEAVWREALAVQLRGAMYCTRLALPYMRQQGGGRIINLTDVGGTQAEAGWAPAGVTRAAGVALTKALAQEYAADGILVNAICVGRIKSAQWTRRWQAHTSHLTLDEYYAKAGEAIPLQRLGEAEDVADLICFLASERARYITGTAIAIDGGLSAAV
jgi:3-oxoacyl-[acyl-carrier protein] reductase